MKKDVYYFQHDYNARNDPKIIKLMMVHGVAGVGIYWCIVEQLYQNGGTLPMEQLESIAFSLHSDGKVIESVVKDFNLFQNDGISFWSDSINKRINKSKELTESRRNAANARWQKANTNAMQLHTTCTNLHSEGVSGSSEKMPENIEKNANASKEDANALQKQQEPIQMQCKVDALNNIIIDNNTLIKDKRVKSDFSPKVDFKKIVDLYHSICTSYPRILKLSEDRKRKIEIRFVDEMKSDWALLEDVFKKMEDSKFLRGDNPRGWKATFDWLFTNAKNWVKVAEGNYANREEIKKGVINKQCNSEWT